MLTIKVKRNLRRFHAKALRWVRRVDSATQADVRAYGAETVKAMVKVTPPGGGRMSKATASGGSKMVSLSVSQSLRRLKERIRQDWEGGGPVPFSEENMRWRRDKQGRLYAVIDEQGADGTRRRSRASAFRIYKGRVTARKLAALGVGKYNIQSVTNIRSWVQKHPSNYRMQKVRGTYHMHWCATRHVASEAAVKAEVRRRQKNAGKLMAGWKAMAAKVGATLPSAVSRQQGNGSAAIRKSRAHRAVLNAHNRGNYSGLQVIVDRQMAALSPRLQSMAKKRARALGKNMK